MLSAVSFCAVSVVVCSRLKLVRAADWTKSCFYLTNTTYTQVYCTGNQSHDPSVFSERFSHPIGRLAGLGQHSAMTYCKLRPVRKFLQWVRSQDDGRMLSKAVIGGFFTYPPPPVSLETYMKERRGEVPGTSCFIKAELRPGVHR